MQGLNIGDAFEPHHGHGSSALGLQFRKNRHSEKANAFKWIGA
jgi:hypothetical protein